MRFLVTNDDGILAPGLAALEAALSALGECVVLAPDRHLSGCSHQATTDRPLALSEAGQGRYALDGTPADCARVGLLHLAPDAEWVISGINAGGNLGADVYLSGTVAAVREGALWNRPGIALSQYIRRPGGYDWNLTARWAQRVIQHLTTLDVVVGRFWNVNFPDCTAAGQEPEIVICDLDPHPLPVRFHSQDGQLHYRGVYQERSRQPGRDVDVCFSGGIAVTELRLAHH